MSGLEMKQCDCRDCPASSWHSLTAGTAETGTAGAVCLQALDRSLANGTTRTHKKKDQGNKNRHQGTSPENTPRIPCRPNSFRKTKPLPSASSPVAPIGMKQRALAGRSWQSARRRRQRAWEVTRRRPRLPCWGSFGFPTSHGRRGY